MKPNPQTSNGWGDGLSHKLPTWPAYAGDPGDLEECWLSHICCCMTLMSYLQRPNQKRKGKVKLGLHLRKGKQNGFAVFEVSRYLQAQQSV
jgi:hypothetical protein